MWQSHRWTMDGGEGREARIRPALGAVYVGNCAALDATLGAPEGKGLVRTKWGCGTTLLHVASSLGNLAVVNVLLRHGADVDASEASGATPLYEAAVVGHVEVVTALLQAGAVAAVSCHTEAWGHQWTPPQLERTVGIRNWHQRRLARCPDAVPAPDFGETPLRAAARLGHVAVLHALVAAGDSVSTEQIGHESPLVLACKGGHVKMVEALLQLGADPNQPSPLGSPPLVLALQRGWGSVARVLLANGASINVDSGLSPLWMSVKAGLVEITKHLLERGARATDVLDSGGTTILMALGTNGVELLPMLLAAGASVNASRTTGETPLWFACRAGLSAVVYALLKAGADPNAASTTGQTPLSVACSQGFNGIVESLLIHGANASDPRCASPLCLALMQRKRDTALLLLLHGADPNMPTLDRRMTPLALCCRHASLPLEAVLAAGAVVNQRVCPSAPDMPFAVPGCTMTPLHIAAHGGLTSACLTLVEHGGDLKATVKSQSGLLTPEQVANMSYQYATAAALNIAGRWFGVRCAWIGAVVRSVQLRQRGWVASLTAAHGCEEGGHM